MFRRLIRGMLLLPFSIALAVLVIIGLLDFDLLMTIIPKLIAVAVIVGVFALIVKAMFFPG